MALLACRRLTRRPWIRDRDLALEPGEIVCLSGPSGSGKTLFLRALADLDPFESGEVLLDGTSRADTPPARWRRQVGYVPARPPRFEGSVAEHLAEVARLADLDPPGEAPAGLPALAPELDCETLSEGESQLLALRRTFLAERRVLLLDEATAGLDPDASAAVEGALRGWVAGGRAILWVSHDADLARRLGARREAFG